jgi:hypothetical protein
MRTRGELSRRNSARASGRTRTRTTRHAHVTGAQVGNQAPPPGAMQMRVAEDAATVHADPAFQQVHSATALVAVGADLRAAEELELRHRSSMYVERAIWFVARRQDSPR